MPVSAPAQTSAQSQTQALVAQVRTYLSDKVDLNVLLQGQVEAGDAQVALAIDMMFSSYNTINPTAIQARQLSDIPMHLRIIGASAQLLKMFSMHQARNQVSLSSDDDEAVGLFDKSPLYSQLAASLADEFQREVNLYKVQRNLGATNAHLGSGYVHATRPRPRGGHGY